MGDKSTQVKAFHDFNSSWGRTNSETEDIIRKVSAIIFSMNKSKNQQSLSKFKMKCLRLYPSVFCLSNALSPTHKQ